MFELQIAYFILQFDIYLFKEEESSMGYIYQFIWYILSLFNLRKYWNFEEQVYYEEEEK